MSSTLTALLSELVTKLLFFSYPTCKPIIWTVILFYPTRSSQHAHIYTTFFHIIDVSILYLECEFFSTNTALHSTLLTKLPYFASMTCQKIILSVKSWNCFKWIELGCMVLSLVLAEVTLAYLHQQQSRGKETGCNVIHLSPAQFYFFTFVCELRKLIIIYIYIYNNILTFFN